MHVCFSPSVEEVASWIHFCKFKLIQMNQFKSRYHPGLVVVTFSVLAYIKASSIESVMNVDNSTNESMQMSSIKRNA